MYFSSLISCLKCTFPIFFGLESLLVNSWIFHLSYEVLEPRALGADGAPHVLVRFRKGGRYGWKPSSSSNFSIRAFSRN